jgi:hypothetical protein
METELRAIAPADFSQGFLRTHFVQVETGGVVPVLGKDFRSISYRISPLRKKFAENFPGAWLFYPAC